MSTLDFQTWLDIVGQTFFDEDFDAYAAYVSIPFTLITREATLTVIDRASLRKGFDLYCRMFQTMGVTDMIRTASGVTAMGPDLLCGNYETHILRGGLRILPPFPSSMALRHEDGRWKAASVTNSWTNRTWPIAFPKVEDDGLHMAARSDGYHDAKPHFDALAWHMQDGRLVRTALWNGLLPSPWTTGGAATPARPDPRPPPPGP